MIQICNRSTTFFPPKNAAYLIGDFTDWDERPLSIDEPLTLAFPEGAYVEYAFLDAQMHPLADPDNQQRPRHPWYEYHRAFTLLLRHSSGRRALSTWGERSSHMTFPRVF